MTKLNVAIWVIIAALHLAVIARAILLAGRDPYARAAWLLLLIALPFVGLILYVLFGEPWTSKRFRQRGRLVYEELLPFAPSPAFHSGGEGPNANAFRTFEGASRWPTSTGNFARLAPDSVTCRIAADAIGSRALINSDLWTMMRQAGARLCKSLEVPFGMAFLAGHRTDLRNHRKVAVIDGRITYCGSQNCADPAFLIKRKFAPWVDILVRFEGPVARQADIIFASAWTVETGEDLGAVMSAQPPRASPTGIPAIATGTGPLSPRGTMSEMFAAVLAAAQSSATITTPYFAPDPPLLAAIVAAARRGVAVRIVFPHRNDSRIVGAIGRAYYPLLVEAGVKIFEFRGGLLHAKTMVVDDTLALIGSSNMDRRSLDLNFENNILLESPEFATQLSDRQNLWLDDAIEIDSDNVTRRPLARRLADNLLTMIAPLF